MSITFCVPYRGHAVVNGNFDAPATAMPRGIGVTRSSDTIVEASAGAEPYGFLDNVVTTDGPSVEELMYVPLDSTIMNEVKVSTGKIRVTLYSPGIEYIMKGNVKSGTAFAVGEQVIIAANGEFTDSAGASAGDIILGVVEEIDVHYMGEDNCIVWKSTSGLGLKV